jgi:O-antigen/teichoic acid export membrane protein
MRKGITWLLHLLEKHGGYFITTFIYTALPLLFLPILTRYLKPEEYANIAIFNFCLTIFNTLGGSAIPAMVSKNFFDKPKEYVARIIGNSYLILFTISFTFTLIIAGFYKPIQHFIDLPLFWLLTIPWCSFFYVIFSLGLTVMRNENKVLTFSFHKITKIVFNVIVSLALVVFLNWGWQGRIWGIFVSNIVTFFTISIYLYKKNYLSLTINQDIIKKTLNLLIYLTPNSFQSVIISQVGIFFMQYFYSKELLGIYSVGFQISFAIKLLFTTIHLSWSPYLYKIFSYPEKVDKQKLVLYLYGLALLLLSGWLFVVLFSDLLLQIFTTKSYFGAKEFVFWLSLGFFFNGLFFLITPILIKLEKQKSISKITIFNVFTMLLLNVVFSKIFGYIGIAYAFCLSYLLMFLNFIVLLNRSFPLPWKVTFSRTFQTIYQKLIKH